MNQLQCENILASLPQKYYVVNRNLKKIIQTNDKSVSLKNDYCFKQIFQIEKPCSINDNICICERMLKNNRDTQFQFETNEGSNKRSYEVKVSVLNEDLILAFLSEITEKKHLQKELKINSKRLNRAEKLADFGYWEFNIDDKQVLASEGAARIYGSPVTQLSLAEVQSFPLHEYRKMLDESLMNLIVHNKPYNVKFKIRRKTDGEIRQIHSIAEYRTDKRMVFGVLHDITEADKIQEALVESENNFQLLFRNMNSGFAFHKIITDEKGHPVDYIFLDVNNKFEELTGLNRKEIIGKNVKNIFPGIDDRWIERYGNVALTGNPVKFSDYSSDIDKYVEIAAYSPKKGYFAVTFTDVTERVNSAKALADSIRDLKMAQQIAKIGNWQFDPHTGVYEWSEEIYKIFGIDTGAGPLKMEDFNAIFGANNYLQLIKSFSNSIENGTSFIYQFKAFLADKKTKWIEFICQPDSKPGPEGYCLRGTVQDINESKQIEVELDNSNKLLRTVIDNIPDTIYMKDRNFRKILANKQDAKHCGVQNMEEILGKTDFELYPPEIAEKYMFDDRKVIESGEPVINREEVFPSGDLKRWVLTSKIPLKNEENQIYGLVGIGRDITERKENESKLKLLQQTIEQAPLSVVITDTSGTIEYVNPGFEKATGYQSEEAIGQNPSVLKSGTHDSAYYKSMWETICSGKNWHGEFHNKRKDGTLYWESVVIAPIVNEKNEIKQFVAIKEDVTEIKKMVKELEIARDKAEESDRLKTVFLANMSHEIRTPLNGILGFSNLICSGLSDKHQLQQYGKIIENSGQRLMTVIDDIIDISMIQSNQLKIVYEYFDINELLEELYCAYKSQKEEKLQNIDFQWKPCSDTVYSNIYSDKNRIYQVFKNLLDNAFKFTERGSINFGCSSCEEVALDLFVEDTGIGIEEDKTGLIFESFRQVEEGSSRKYDGSGLGLAITSGIIEKLGGRIDVQSEFKKGTIFRLTLPRRNRNIFQDVQQLNRKEVNNKAVFKSKRIVSFEDDKTSYQYLKIAIELLGYELVNFESAQPGIDYLKTNGADLVLMDVQLPEMNGYEATRIIKTEIPGIPVIIQSAFAMKEYRDKAIQAGSDDFISKPISMKTLKEKLEKYMQQNILKI